MLPALTYQLLMKIRHVHSCICPPPIHINCCILIYNYCNTYFGVLPRHFQHGSPPPHAFNYYNYYFFAVVTKMIDVVTNSTQTTLVAYAFKLTFPAMGRTL